MAILVIAHRLSTVRKADYIYFLENGILVEEGTWTSLLVKEDGRFRELYGVQSGNVIINNQFR